MLRWILIGGLIFVGGCAPTLEWVSESSPYPSCLPNRLLTWEDFSKKDPPSATPAAQTAMRFLLKGSPPHLVAQFDQEFSWVRSKPANPTNSAEWVLSEKLLAHEQVHFLISCLLVRQANGALRAEENPMKMLHLVKSVAQRINLQYDQDTDHGRNKEAQARWEADVQQQFEDVGSLEEQKVVTLH